LFLNEQISPVASGQLRERGFDVVSPHDLRTRGASDAVQFDWAAAKGRAVVTYNIADFCPLADQYLARGKDHYGLVLVSESTIPQRDLGALIRGLGAALKAHPADDALLNQTVFLAAVSPAIA
jgi:hypothetical protein